MDVSIVIPAYNAEKYIGRCLKSVLRALVAAGNAVSGEVIVVDNGSSDKTLTVARECFKEISSGDLKQLKVRTCVLQCNTHGASAARNFGFKKACGKYIWFIDADDEIREDAVAKLMQAAKGDGTGADLVMMGAERIYPDGHKDYLSAVMPEKPDFKSRFVRYGMGPWQILIRRKWWMEQGFKFREGIMHEDMELLSAFILYTDRFVGVDEPLYLYYQNEGSVIHKSKFDPHIFDIFPALEGLYRRFKEAGAEGEYHDELEWFFIWNLLIDSAKDFSAFPEGKPGFKRSREMLSKYFPGWRKNRFLHEKPLKLRVKVRLNYLR